MQLLQDTPQTKLAQGEVVTSTQAHFHTAPVKDKTLLTVTLSQLQKG